MKAHARDVGKLRHALEALGCVFTQPMTQDDAIYVRNTGSLDTYLSNAEFLRLRVQGDGTVLFTMKYHEGRASDIASAPLEYETSVGSREQMERILSLMGFTEAARVKKSRIKTRHANWEVCIDEVAGLGAFIELEELAAESADIGAIQAKMRDFLASLGVEASDTGLQRYDVLILQQKA